MKRKAVSVLFAASAAFLLMGSQDGQAQQLSQRQQAQVRGHHSYARRSTTRIVVTRRSYLDAGTEVMPGDRKFTDYIFPPGYNPSYVGGFDPVGATFYPLSAPFFPRWP